MCNTDYCTANSKINAVLIQSWTCPRPGCLCVFGPPSGIQVCPAGHRRCWHIPHIVLNHTEVTTKWLQQPLKKSLPLLRNMKCIPSGPSVLASLRLSHNLNTFKQPLFLPCCLQMQLEGKNKRFCVCPPTGKQQFLLQCSGTIFLIC